MGMLAVLVGFLVLGPKDPGYPFTFDYEKFADESLSAYARSERFSGAALVAAKGTTVFRKAYGFADWEHRVPMTLDKPCVIFSMSKMFTAAAILILQDRGRLKVTDPIRKWMPEWPKEWDGVTIHHLLTHTSGISTATIYGKDLSGPHPLVSVPGAEYRYSNFGFTLLAKIIARVGKRPYSEFLRENIFKPLHMTTAGTGGYLDGNRNMARGHLFIGDRYRITEQDLKVIEGAGDVHATVDDLLKWSEALDRPGFLSAASLQAMFTPYHDADPGAKTGYGWNRDDKTGDWTFSGIGEGYCGWIGRYQRGLRVIILENLSNENAGLPTHSLWFLGQGENAYVPHDAPLSEMAKYVGGYHFPDGSRAQALISRAGLVITVPSHPRAVYEWKDGRTFGSDETTVEFLPNRHGTYDMCMKSGSTWTTGARDELSAADAKGWAGAYGVGNTPMINFMAKGASLWNAGTGVQMKFIRSGPLSAPLCYLGNGTFATSATDMEYVFGRTSAGKMKVTFRNEGKDIGSVPRLEIGSSKR